VTLSICLSFSVVYFNWAECGGRGRSVLQLLFGGPFYLLTILFRAASLALGTPTSVCMVVILLASGESLKGQ
jgi:hypothetical protein